MPAPALDDTIIAVSSGWEASPVGIVRLSGAASFALARAVGADIPEYATSTRPSCTAGRVWASHEVSLPATVFSFRQPRSYTGQDLVELHVPGCLPLLRELCGRLIELGARRALPGEFTARAFLSGRISAEQVDDVLTTLHATSTSDARRTGREHGVSQARLVDDLRERITNLLAAVEAGIDFVDEEDIRFITAGEVCTALDGMLQSLADFGKTRRGEAQADRKYVTLAGLPNAGKSTLFNALVGYERALVSPVLGTTRDVLSVEIGSHGVRFVLQDCAGLGAAEGELEMAAHRLAEQVAEEADLVLWVHALDQPWSDHETHAAGRLPIDRRILVWSKSDLAQDAASRPIPAGFSHAVPVSAATGAGLAALRTAIFGFIGQRRDVGGMLPLQQQLRATAAAIERARERAAADDKLAQPELLALELRTAYETLVDQAEGLVEGVLGRIFSEFCVGK